MRTFVAGRLWRARYARTVRRTFATVPLYRETWALDGRTDPVLVPGRTGRLDGAIPTAVARHRAADLVPLAGGEATPDPERGLPELIARVGRSRPLVRTRPADVGTASGDDGVVHVLHDEVLGHLGWLADCGRWHLDWRRVYARSTAGGLAFTVLGATSPRLVDLLPAGGPSGEVTWCPRHGTPVIAVSAAAAATVESRDDAHRGATDASAASSA